MAHVSRARTHFVVDTELAQKIKRKKKREEQIDSWKQQTYNEIKDAAYVNKFDTSRANPQRQLGRPLMWDELERRLKKLLPELFFIGNEKFRGAYIERDGQKFRVAVYNKGLLPERSIREAKEEIVWDRSTLHLDRKDIPKQEFVPGVGFVKSDPNALTPGTERVLIPWGEAYRGWRTVLLRFMDAGLLNPAQIEAEFGSDDTPEWAGHMGKRVLTTPW